MAIMMLLLIPQAFGMETDQFNNREQAIEDSQNLLNKKVNLAIGNSIDEIDDPQDTMKIVNRIYLELGGFSSRDKIEKWAMQSENVDRLDITSNDSIYADIPFWATRIGGLAGIGATIKLNGVLVGTDKLGHFFSQGRKFYIRWLQLNDVEMVAKKSAFTEKAVFGMLSTGIYSNADLVANYEGFRFYRGLFEADLLNNKPAILKWQDDHWIMQRPFVWSDYVNDYWDEALNINQYDSLLYPYMHARLLELCDGYQANPKLYTINNENVLKQRYADLQLVDTTELRLGNLCLSEAGLSAQSTPSRP